MSGILILSAAVGGALMLGAAGSLMGAYTLYKKVIPRQTECRVDANEMADMSQWEIYKKIIHSNKDYLSAREKEVITIKSRDNLSLYGEYFPADTLSDTTVICFHGYTSTGWDSCASIAAFFIKEGYNCLIVDNRAHGKSEGDYVGFGILDRYDALSWIEHINKAYNPKNVILYGVSMGGATVVMTSGLPNLPQNVKAIVSDCAFTSPFDVFSHILKRDYHLPKFPVMNFNNMLTRKNAGYGFSDYSTLDAVKVTKVPIIFIHGEKDDFVPTYMSRQNFEACQSPKELVIIENASHAAAYYENVSLYEAKVKNFLSKFI
ncbi:MAG: alpha/beta hydrolase [Clostridia bacterium]|nr:alpha/beta hydrolase [Clostridia bacterium]